MLTLNYCDHLYCTSQTVIRRIKNKDCQSSNALFTVSLLPIWLQALCQYFDMWNCFMNMPRNVVMTAILFWKLPFSAYFNQSFQDWWTNLPSPDQYLDTLCTVSSDTYQKTYDPLMLQPLHHGKTEWKKLLRNMVQSNSHHMFCQYFHMRNYFMNMSTHNILKAILF